MSVLIINKLISDHSKTSGTEISERCELRYTITTYSDFENKALILQKQEIEKNNNDKFIIKKEKYDLFLTNKFLTISNKLHMHYCKCIELTILFNHKIYFLVSHIFSF